MFRLILLFQLVLLIIDADAQQTLYSQYMLNKFLVNPAFAGAEGYTSLSLSARKSWLNYKAAPRVVSVSGHTRILSKSRMSKSRSIKKRTKKRRPKGRVGLGGHIYTDQNAAISQTGLQGTYAYHIPIRSSQLSFGMSLSAYQFRIDKDMLITADPDPLIETLQNKILPDANFGAFYTIYGFYAGYSTSQLFGKFSEFSSNKKDIEMVSGRSHNIISGYQYDFENDFEMEGSFMFNLREGESVQAEISAKGIYLRNYWLGFSYKTTNELVTFVGGGAQNFFFGYSFDIHLNKTESISRSSHEIFIGYRFGDNRRRYRWLNRF